LAQLFLGIDSGTQGTKAIVVSRDDGNILAEGYAPHRLLEDQTGLREQEPAWWIAACREAIASAIRASGATPSDIRAIGVSGQQHGFVPLDLKGDVIRPAKLWCDTATADQAARMTTALGGADKVVAMLGNAIAVGFTASKILWLKENEPDNYSRLATILLPHDYINFWLTGERKCEFGDASGTAYFDVQQRTWARAVLDVIDDSGKLADCLPELVQAQQPVGRIRKTLAKELGFREDVLISSGGGDNMMAAIGTGNVTSGIVTASLGTSGTIYCFSESPIVDPQGELASFCSSDGNWLPLVCTMNVTVATELCRDLLKLAISELNQHVGKSPVGAQGLLFLPYFNGERTPALPQARATLYGITSGNFTRDNVGRAAMEGATFGLRYGLDIMRKYGIAPAEIRLVGGGAKSAVWRQIVADVFGCPVVCPHTAEAGALGAALQALWCYAGHCGESTTLPEICEAFVSLDEATRAAPRSDHVSAYDTIYTRYLKLDSAVRCMYA
jgi:D-xylulose kinase